VDRPSIILSSFKPSKDTVRALEDGTLSIILAPGEVSHVLFQNELVLMEQRLVIIGQLEISVQKGHLSIMGSILRPSKRFYRVFAPSSHSLPVIRCLATDTESAELRLHPFEAGLRSLELLSPLFGKLWNEGRSPLGPEYTDLVQKSKGATFQVVSLRLRLTSCSNKTEYQAALFL
jgi:polynucleotide 5'-hydroxyl-kinase GRC3/NOL9